MKYGILSTLAVCVVAISASASPAPARDSKSLYELWGKVKGPLSLSGKADPIGTYAAGCLSGAEALPLDGAGYSVMHPSRLRYFGHPNLVGFIRDLGARLKGEGLPLLLVGDMGRPRGGPMISGHNSHQIGLDVDLWFRLSRKRPSSRDRESWVSPSYVGKKGELTRSWGQQQRELIATAAAAPEVERVFVNASIKRDMCTKYADAPWLYKVRAWWGHGDHLHVRLQCPAGSQTCQHQEPLDPKKTQCGEELAWWFTTEAAEEGAKKQVAERPFPELPAACEQMVQELEVKRL
jgi:penicillin-insensitive murein DD-endopeptidase